VSARFAGRDVIGVFLRRLTVEGGGLGQRVLVVETVAQVDAVKTFATAGKKAAVQVLRHGIVAGVHLHLRQQPEAIRVLE
jgi:hypothetical protein